MSANAQPKPDPVEEAPAVAAPTHEDHLDDVKQLGLFAAIGSLSYVFWVVGGMEMVERLAYYGVKAVATLYAKDPVSKGGLGITLSEFGTLMMVWALIQSILPAFTGGLSDRYGYKKTIAVSVTINICGYLTMAALPFYWGFFAGAILLATGTAVFKPGIQGTLVKSTRRDNSSMAWGIFYQTVNIGGFLAPLVAGYMRKMQWTYVFVACACIISLNFLMLLLYEEPGKAERLARAAAEKQAGTQRKSLAAESLRELSKPHVWPYLLIFSGFWFMFNSLFDVLPAHIEEWVDTRDIVGSLFGGHGTTNPVIKFFVVMNKQGTEINPEGMLNINAMLIMFTCFLFAAVSGKMRAITSMVVGTSLATVALIASGWSVYGWISVGAIGIFSIGEMLSSPKFSEYIGNFAPSDKKAMYLGFSQIPLAIGWTLESKIGMSLYDHFASKDAFSRELLATLLRDHKLGAGELARLFPMDTSALSRICDWFLEVPKTGTAASLVSTLPQGEAFSRLVDALAVDKWDLTHQLYATHNPGVVWYIMAIVGVFSAYGIWWYGKWVVTIRK